jgi:Tol biopolymer transport system component
VNRIAYLDDEGALYAVNPDGSNREMLTAGATVGLNGIAQDQEEVQTFYSWPTWSPDGKWLAVSRVMVKDPDDIEVGLFSLNMESREAIQVYQNPADVTAPVAPGIPHYMYWSPDSEHLTFLAWADQGMTLFVSSLDDPETLDALVTGSPLYLTWAANNRNLLLHVGEQMFLADVTKPEELIELPPKSRAFQAPAWSPDGQRMAYVAEDFQGGNALFVAGADGENGQPIVPVGERVAFLWSPSGDWIALIETDKLASPFYQSLKIVQLQDSAVETVSNEDIIAFFSWSPNGEKVAYMALDRSQAHLSLKVTEPNGQPRKLADFIPSGPLSVMLSFFDQYAYSNSLWAPDSRHLVLTGQIISESDGSSGALDKSQVYVVDTDSLASAKAIAEGTLAFWSWN